MHAALQLELPRIIPISLKVLPANWMKFCVKNRVKLYVVVLYENDAENGKLWPAQEIVVRGINRGDHKGTDTIIDSTSGNYGVALATVIRQFYTRDHNFPIKKVVSVVSRSLPQGKRERLLKYGIELIDADGQVEAMRVAETVAKERGYWYTKQYWNEDNSRGYVRVADHIAEALPMLGMVAWGVGSGGGCSGVMPVLQQHFGNRSRGSAGFHRVAVVVEDGQKIGGVRDEAALEPGSLNWRAPNIDDVRFVGEDVSYLFSAALWRQGDTGCLGGPSTGFAAEGACLAARRLVIMRQFNDIRASDGFVHILVPSLDTREPYRDEYGERGIYWQ